MRVIALLVLAVGCGPARADRPAPRMAAFQCDATPPLGHPLPARDDTVQVVDMPLRLKGILLEQGSERYVVAALDWCTLSTLDYTLFRNTMASAADTRPERVTVHCTHTHSGPTRRGRRLEFAREVARRAGTAVRDARARLRPFTHVGFGAARVERFASNRRIWSDVQNRILTRWSRTKDPELIAAPEGVIDPWLRTVTLLHGDRPLARLHYYATHPQSHYGDGHCHPDVPGWARARLEEEEGIPHLYFTGCAGDITAGKYNDGSPEARAALIERLVAGMRGAIAASRPHAVESVSWRTRPVRLPRAPRDQPPEAGKTRDPIDLIRLSLGPVDILHLPGEPFIEYQRFAHRRHPDELLAVAGYGDGDPGYICTDAAYGRGGYEPTASNVGPPVEGVLKEAIRELLD